MSLRVLRVTRKRSCSLRSRTTEAGLPPIRTRGRSSLPVRTEPRATMENGGTSAPGAARDLGAEVGVATDRDRPGPLAVVGPEGGVAAADDAVGPDADAVG